MTGLLGWVIRNKLFVLLLFAMRECISGTSSRLVDISRDEEGIIMSKINERGKKVMSSVERIEPPSGYTICLDKEGINKIQDSTKVQTAELIHNILIQDGYAYVEVLEGDYKGSIAKFTVTEKLTKDFPVHMCYCRDIAYNFKHWWKGKLSWKGKRNNPQFKVSNSSCVILQGYEGDTILKRFDIRKEAKKLLDDTELCDIDGNILKIGDEVLYMNLRYGCGGRLDRGVIKEFKPHARQQYISVIISNMDGDEESELNYPNTQILKI